MLNPYQQPWQETNAEGVLRAYGFELDPARLGVVLADYENQYGREWMLLAIVESLYQGRYKVTSVGQILRCWQRRGQPRLSFDREFQRFVLGEAWQPIVAPVPDTTDFAPVESVPRPPAISALRVERKLRALVGLSQAV